MSKSFYDEMTTAGGRVRAHYRSYRDWLSIIPPP